MKAIYISATKQNRGKTIVCLGLLDVLLKKGYKVGFIKPVGQRYVVVDGENIDEDAVLVKEIFGGDYRLKDSSPIAIEKGFTEKYIKEDGKNLVDLIKHIKESYERIKKDKDIVIIEGTGHAGVGSVFDLSNAEVAKILGVKVLIVSGGGIGQPIDEIVLNKSLFEKIGVEILGAIINKVQKEKYDKIKTTVTAGLKRKNIDVFGVIPFVPLLSYLTMELIIESIKGEIISGKDNLNLLIKKIIVGAMFPHQALSYIDEGVLVIIPGTREDILFAIMSSSLIEHKKSIISGIVLTGGVKPHMSVVELLEKLNIPTYAVEEDTYYVASVIHDLLVKIRAYDKLKIDKIKELAAEYIDIEKIIDKI